MALFYHLDRENVRPGHGYRDMVQHENMTIAGVIASLQLQSLTPFPTITKSIAISSPYILHILPTPALSQLPRNAHLTSNIKDELPFSNTTLQKCHRSHRISLPYSNVNIRILTPHPGECPIYPHGVPYSSVLQRCLSSRELLCL